MKKLKILITTTLLAFSLEASAQVDMIRKNPTLSAGVVVGGIVYHNSAMHIARDLSLKLHEVGPFFKKNPNKFNPVADYVLGKLNNPQSRAEYDRYKKLAIVMGLNTPPYRPTVNNGPIVHTTPQHQPNPNHNVYPYIPGAVPANVIYSPQGEMIDTGTEFPGQKIDTWEDYLNYNFNVRELERNMIADGMGDKPFWYSPHHIVAWNDPRAADSRKLLSDEGILFNDADNGVYLPQREKNRLPNDISTLHTKIHTNKYHQEVEIRLRPFIGKPTEMRQELRNIAHDIKNNNFPY